MSKFEKKNHNTTLVWIDEKSGEVKIWLICKDKSSQYKSFAASVNISDLEEVDIKKTQISGPRDRDGLLLTEPLDMRKEGKL